MEEVGRVVGGYSLDCKIGSGSYSKVFLCRHLKSKVLYALKIIEKKVISNIKLQESLYMEIKIMREYKHVNIVCLKESFSYGKYICLVVDYAAGGDLSDYIKNRGKLNESIASTLLYQLSLGMEFLSTKGVIHRDLKPQNLLLSDATDYPVLKVADFGFARHLKDAASMAQTPCGTPLYMAPEVYLLRDYNGKADCWSIGCIYHEMLTGSPPFMAHSPRQLFIQIKSKGFIMTKDLKSASQQSKSLITMMLQVKPENRISLEGFFLSSYRLHILHHSAKEKPSLPSPVIVSTATTSTTSTTSTTGIRQDKRLEDSFVIVESNHISSHSVNLINCGTTFTTVYEKMDMRGIEDDAIVWKILVETADGCLLDAQAYNQYSFTEEIVMKMHNRVARACAIYYFISLDIRRLIIKIDIALDQLQLQLQLQIHQQIQREKKDKEKDFVKSVRASLLSTYELIFKRMKNSTILVTSLESLEIPEFTPIITECASHIQKIADVEKFKGNQCTSNTLQRTVSLMLNIVTANENGG